MRPCVTLPVPNKPPERMRADPVVVGAPLDGEEVVHVVEKELFGFAFVSHCVTLLVSCRFASRSTPWDCLSCTPRGGTL